VAPVSVHSAIEEEEEEDLFVLLLLLLLELRSELKQGQTSTVIPFQ
jgi:hypothetical protein